MFRGEHQKWFQVCHISHTNIDWKPWNCPHYSIVGTGETWLRCSSFPAVIMMKWLLMILLNLDQKTQGSLDWDIGHRYHVNKDRFKKDFKCHVTEQWNHLPKAVVDAPTLNTFKNRLDQLWERDGVMHNSDIDVHIRTSKRNTRTRIST